VGGDAIASGLRVVNSPGYLSNFCQILLERFLGLALATSPIKWKVSGLAAPLDCPAYLLHENLNKQVLCHRSPRDHAW
ncbi:MAG TPA: hypothetical protein PKW79_04220, partial [Rhabdochlamydiaceae bacterium]|nr:hypothetical protein [Rhabdochlamydiaceae bacterium]